MPYRIGPFAVTAAVVVATAGCNFGPRPEVAARMEDVCGVGKDGAPLKAPELVARANLVRDEALREMGSGAPFGGETNLIKASDCYLRALRLAPDNYEANLGLGIVNLGRARNASDSEERRAPYLLAAKRAFGRAYMTRQGPFDPVYYLAEVAVLEKDMNRAERLLEVLEKAKGNLGPVYALRGYIAEEKRQRADAYRFYQLALESGCSGQTLEFVAQKVMERRR
jgi:tetratricopeptide (TPR) repeat protein